MANLARTIKQVLEVKRACSRQGTSHSKTRGEVSGGGRKPWKQKGTGRARAGSNRSPIWRGGGITFGPQRTQKFHKRINQKMLQLAHREIMSELTKQGKIGSYDKQILEFTKTRQLSAWLQEKKLLGKKVYFLVDSNCGNLLLTASNLPGVEVIRRDNAFFPHLATADYVFTSSVEKATTPKHAKKEVE